VTPPLALGEELYKNSPSKVDESSEIRDKTKNKGYEKHF
jgi:hypothetical protein